MHRFFRHDVLSGYYYGNKNDMILDICERIEEGCHGHPFGTIMYNIFHIKNEVWIIGIKERIDGSFFVEDCYCDVNENRYYYLRNGLHNTFRDIEYFRNFLDNAIGVHRQI